MFLHSVKPSNQAMETATIAQCSLLRFPSETDDKFPRKCHLGVRDFRVSERPRRCFARLSTRFSDSGHQQYYVSQKREDKKKEKEKSSEVKLLKKKLKFIKRLSHDLTRFSVETFGKESANTLADDKKISEAVKVLKAQLLQLRSEQKELKRKRKEKKAQIETFLKQNKGKCKFESSSSSSSESSDSEHGEVIDMTRLRSNVFRQSKDSAGHEKIEEATLAEPSSLIQQDKSDEAIGIGDSSSRNHSEGEWSSGSNGCSDDQSNSIVAETTIRSIEICMGGKCKKLGAETLLQEFGRKVGAKLGVSGCKCMGKCKDGPNLRVLNGHNRDEAREMHGHVRTDPSISSLCIGVGLEDVDVILANFLAKDGNDKYLIAHS